MNKKTLLTLLIIILPYYLLAQGCSDAGVCTINSFKPNNNDSLSVYKNQVKAGISYGIADNSIYVVGSYLEYNRTINNRLSFDLKLTTLIQNGNDISSIGFSDIYINGSYKTFKKTGITLGLKIPLNDASAMFDGLPLPMDYQSSLGTFDLIIGISQEIKKLQLALALQQPLSQNNNAFFSDLYPEGSPLRNIQSTNKFIRSGDLIFRVSYPFMLGEKFKLTPSILSIYHLENDKYTTMENIEMTIVGSQGITLNANLYLDYSINERNNLNFSFGAPFVVRNARPDGLTRKYVLNLEYAYNF